VFGRKYRHARNDRKTAIASRSQSKQHRLVRVSALDRVLEIAVALGRQPVTPDRNYRARRNRVIEERTQYRFEVRAGLWRGNFGTARSGSGIIIATLPGQDVFGKGR
jgi:hypothetical protein